MKIKFKSLIFFALATLLVLFFKVEGQQQPEKLETQEVSTLGEDVSLTLAKIKNARPFLSSGEKLKFKVVFIGLTAGYASFEMRPATVENGQLFFQLSAEAAKWVANIYTLKMSMFSYAEPDTFATVKYIEEKKERKNYYYATQYFSAKNGMQAQLKYTWRKNNTYKQKDFSQALRGVSVPAAFYFARTTDLEVGKTYYTTCAFRDRIVPIGVEVVEKKRVKTEYGRQDTVVIRPLMRFDGLISDQRDMLIYLSDDEYKIPLRMEAVTKFGTFKALLIEGYETQAALNN